MSDKCIRCGSKKNLNKHHIIYVPELVETLCVECHWTITALNAIATPEDSRIQLPNDARIVIWNRFMSGMFVQPNTHCIQSWWPRCAHNGCKVFVKENGILCDEHIPVYWMKQSCRNHKTTLHFRYIEGGETRCAECYRHMRKPPYKPEYDE